MCTTQLCEWGQYGDKPTPTRERIDAPVNALPIRPTGYDAFNCVGVSNNNRLLDVVDGNALQSKLIGDGTPLHPLGEFTIISPATTCLVTDSRDADLIQDGAS
jgi:hypothetical protein